MFIDLGETVGLLEHSVGSGATLEADPAAHLHRGRLWQPLVSELKEGLGL